MSTFTYFAYDKSQRLTTQYVPAGEARYYGYNQRNMVTSILDLGGPDAARAFTYNGIGERVVAVDNTNSQPAYWSYDGARLLQDRERAPDGSFNSTTVNYRTSDLCPDRCNPLLDVQ